MLLKLFPRKLRSNTAESWKGGQDALPRKVSRSANGTNNRETSEGLASSSITYLKGMSKFSVYVREREDVILVSREKKVALI